MFRIRIASLIKDSLSDLTRIEGAIRLRSIELEAAYRRPVPQNQAGSA